MRQGQGEVWWTARPDDWVPTKLGRGSFVVVVLPPDNAQQSTVSVL
jgi:hypothetical protein